MPQSFRGISRKEAREVDRRAVGTYRIPSLLLMENAGAGAARVALERWSLQGSSVVCLCGIGANGGDALVVARHLALAGADVKILCVRGGGLGRLRGDSARQRSIVRALGLPILIASTPDADRALDAAELVVDGLFGTGLDRPLAGPYATLVEAVNARSCPVLALDVPSGFDCDSGRPIGPCVRASVTATFVERKIGFARRGARRWTGEVEVVGIGAPLRWPPRSGLRAREGSDASGPRGDRATAQRSSRRRGRP